MICSKCGIKNSGNGLFCKKCGASLVNDVLDNNQEKSRMKNYYDNDNESNKDKIKKSRKTKTINKNINKTVNKSVNKKKSKDNKNNSNTKIIERTQIVHKMSGFQKFIFFLMFLFIIILILALACVCLYVANEKTTKVPNVIGMSSDKAIKVLESKDLEVKVIEVKVEDEDDVKIVLKQNKKAGSYILKGNLVKITVGSYEKEEEENTNIKKIDSYIGLDIDSAIRKLEHDNIKYEIQEIESLEENGKVISQTPTAGTKLTDSIKITLTVSKNKQEEKTDEKEKSNQIEEDL